MLTDRNVQDLLGPVKLLQDERLKAPRVGVVTGLAWTSTGGEVLFVEALKMPGKGGLMLTGQLGDVMKESAQAALSYIRSRGDAFEIEPEVFQKIRPAHPLPRRRHPQGRPQRRPGHRHGAALRAQGRAGARTPSP